VSAEELSKAKRPSPEINWGVEQESLPCPKLELAARRRRAAMGKSLEIDISPS
jgi:hypothetical protein